MYVRSAVGAGGGSRRRANIPAAWLPGVFVRYSNESPENSLAGEIAYMPECSAYMFSGVVPDKLCIGKLWVVWLRGCDQQAVHVLL